MTCRVCGLTKAKARGVKCVIGRITYSQHEWPQSTRHLDIERLPVALNGANPHARPSTCAVRSIAPTRGEGSLTSPAPGVEPVLLANGSTPSGGGR